MTIDHRDDRLLAISIHEPSKATAFREEFVGASASNLFEVGSGTEDRTGPCQDADLRCFVTLELVEVRFISEAT